MSEKILPCTRNLTDCSRSNKREFDEFNSLNYIELPIKEQACALFLIIDRTYAFAQIRVSHIIHHGTAFGKKQAEIAHVTIFSPLPGLRPVPSCSLPVIPRFTLTVPSGRKENGIPARSGHTIAAGTRKQCPFPFAFGQQLVHLLPGRSLPVTTPLYKGQIGNDQIP